jgi:hypothetical protein
MEGNGRLRLDPLVGNRALAVWHLSAQATTGPCPAASHPPTCVSTTATGTRSSISTSTGVLAVYWVHPDGTLVRLDRWPSEIETY